MARVRVQESHSPVGEHGIGGAGQQQGGRGGQEGSRAHVEATIRGRARHWGVTVDSAGRRGSHEVACSRPMRCCRSVTLSGGEHRSVAHTHARAMQMAYAYGL